jgi:hypothetical protein
MAETETTISTPEDATVETETATDELVEDTSTSDDAPETDTSTAETETDGEQTQGDAQPPEQKLYAGKYSSIEELEKGYGELNKAFTQANQIKAKYDELLKKQQEQQTLQYEQAKKAGYNSVEEQQIANNVRLAEFNEFWNNLQYLDADSQPTVQQYLTEYYKTGNADFLKAAKSFYSAEFLERVAIGKKDYESQLKNELTTKRNEIKNKQTAELAETIRTDYAEFLSDINENTGKAKALKAFCDADFIQSKDDMKVFADIYGEMETFIKAAAIKEYEAQKAIEKTKQAAQIQSDAGIISPDTMPTIEQLEKMSQEDYNKAVAKYGTQKLFSQKV